MLKNILAKALSAVIIASTLATTVSAYTIVEYNEVTLSKVYASPETINAEDGEEMDINYCIDYPADVKVGIYRLDDNNKPETVQILTNDYLEAGCYSSQWDGEDDYRPSETGSYYFGVQAENQISEDYVADWVTVENGDVVDPDEDIKIVDVEVDNKTFNPHDNQEAEITFHLNRDAYVTVTIFEYDDDDEVEVIEDDEFFKKGKHTVEWDGRDKYGDYVSQGKYDFEIRAEADGEKDIEDGTLKVDKDVDYDEDEETEDPRIKRNYTTKAEFDPGRHERTYIVFELTAEADLLVEIYDEDGNFVEELEDDEDADAGVYRIKWDGDEALNDEGTYTYKITAENSEGEDEVEGEIIVSEDDKDNNKPNVYKDSADIEDLPFEPKKEDLTISFTLEKEAEVTLEIRDGSETIAEILDEEELGEGAYSFQFDGRDEYGSYLTDGIYKYKLTAANFKGKDVEWGYFSVEGSSYAKNLENCAGFTDVNKNSSKCDAIAWAKNNDIFVGYEGGQFRPNQAITRTEALKVILEALDVKTLESNAVLRSFPDLEAGAWYMKYIRTGLSLGIINGYPNGMFRPNQPVNRVEALVMMLNTGAAKDGLLIPTNNYGQPYYDTPNATSTQWYMSYVWMAKNYNLSSNDSYFYPDSYMTRADMADMLYRYHVAGLDN